ncbi:MAG TPA: DoxX family protein [Bryobacteraceae bacterium]|nr:DoxX family protein [Bryobacteraceae bacterium]
MLKKFFSTDTSWALLLVRFPLGLDMFVHGYMKMTNIPGTMRYFDGLNVPHVFAWLAIIAEFFGGLGLMLGLLSRIAAFGAGVTMLVAIFLRHLPYGYLMNWHGALPFGTEGYEYHTLAIGMALAVMIAGAGAFSVDRAIASRWAVSHALAPASPERMPASSRA